MKLAKTVGQEETAIWPLEETKYEWDSELQRVSFNQDNTSKMSSWQRTIRIQIVDGLSSAFKLRFNRGYSFQLFHGCLWIRSESFINIPPESTDLMNILQRQSVCVPNIRFSRKNPFTKSILVIRK